MKPAKAIDIKTKVINYEMPCWMPEALEADKLGIEALKRVEYNRQTNMPLTHQLLPGETEC